VHGVVVSTASISPLKTLPDVRGGCQKYSSQQKQFAVGAQFETSPVLFAHARGNAAFKGLEPAL
jgi:hypothetical protein